MKTFISSILAMSVLAMGSFAADSAVKGKEKAFIKDAYEDGLAEVSLGQMAVSKATNPDVKAFGQHMIDDHSKTNAELKALADSKQVEVASEPNMVSKGSAKMLENKSGAEFDKDYVDAAVKAHAKAVKAFAKAANEAEDPDVKKLAEKTLPGLEGHLKMAQELQSKIGK